MSKLPKNRPCLRILGYRLQRTEGGPWRGQRLAVGLWGAQADARGPAVRRGGPGVWETRGAAREPGEGEPGGDGSRRGAWKGSQRCGGRARAETQSRARRPSAASEWTPRRRSRDSGTQAEPAPGPFSGSDSEPAPGLSASPSLSATGPARPPCRVHVAQTLDHLRASCALLLFGGRGGG